MPMMRIGRDMLPVIAPQGASAPDCRRRGAEASGAGQAIRPYWVCTQSAELARRLRERRPLSWERWAAKVAASADEFDQTPRTLDL
jgi:hypothetical protein